MRAHVRLLAVALLSLLLTGATVTATVGAAQAQTEARTSYIQVLDDVMCVVCHEPLSVAQSPEAFQERDYIRQEIAAGKTRAQIENDLVQQYGPAVLARPPAHGVNVLVYIVPPVVLILGIGTLAVFIPRWRRRALDDHADREDHATRTSGGRELDPADAQRLNDDLGRFA